MRRIVLVQSCARAWLAKRRKNQLIKQTKAAILIQKIYRGWKARKLLKILVKYKGCSDLFVSVQASARRLIQRKRYIMLVRRIENLKEIISTETTYVTRLESVVRVFMEPMKLSGVANRDQIRAIFSELEIVLAYNTMLLGELSCRMQKLNADTCVGDIFVKMSDFLKVYTQYVNNYNVALVTVNQLKKNEKFAHFLQNALKDPRCLGLDLTAFLILPIQRIPRYVLLLEDLFRNTPKRHPDHEKLSESLWKMRSVAGYVNEKKREAETIHEVLLVQDKLTGKMENLAQPHRRYLREGYLTDLVTKRKLYYFLFNDLLVGTKKSQKPFTSSCSFKYMHKIPIDESTAVMMGTYGKQPCFEVTTSSSYEHMMFAADDMDGWVSDILATIDRITTASRHRSVDSSTSSSSPIFPTASPTVHMRPAVSM